MYICIYVYIYVYKNIRLATLACRFDGKVCFHHACAHKLKKNGSWNCFFFNFCAQAWANLQKHGAREVPKKCPGGAREMLFACFSVVRRPAAREF